MSIKEIKIPFALRGNINIVNKSEGQRIIAGYANVAVVDSEEQFIPVETLKAGINTLLNDPYYSNLMLVHQNIQIGKIIPKFGEYTTHVDEKGLYIVCEIRQDLKIADEIWDNILNNSIHGFSIGCEVLSSHKKCDETKCITILDKINIFEVSICTRPVNEASGFVVISKSKIGDVCYECILDKDKMEQNEVKPIEKTVEKPVIEKAPDQFAELKQRIDSLESLINDAKKKPIEEIKPPETTCEEKKIPPVPPMPSATPPPVEQPKKPEEKPQEPPVGPKEENPPIWSNEEDMALFMLDYIIANPKSSAQDIAKAWIESKKKAPLPKPEVPKPEVPVAQPPIPEKMGEVMDKLSSIVDKLTRLSAEEELKLAIKSRDDQIAALQTQAKTFSKIEPIEVGTPKTIQEESKSVELKKESPIRKYHGSIYFQE